MFSRSSQEFPGKHLYLFNEVFSRGEGHFSPLLVQYFEYSTHHEIRHNIQKELCLHGTDGVIKLEECQYKGHNTITGPQQRWELREVERWRSHFLLHTLSLFFTSHWSLDSTPKQPEAMLCSSALPSLKPTLSLETCHLLLCLLMLVFIKTQTLICNMSGFVAKTSESPCCLHRQLLSKGASKPSCDLKSDRFGAGMMQKSSKHNIE